MNEVIGRLVDHILSLATGVRTKEFRVIKNLAPRWYHNKHIIKNGKRYPASMFMERRIVLDGGRLILQRRVTEIMPWMDLL